MSRLVVIVEANNSKRQERGGVKQYIFCIKIKNLMPFNVSRKKINQVPLLFFETLIQKYNLSWKRIFGAALL